MKRRTRVLMAVAMLALALPVLVTGCGNATRNVRQKTAMDSSIKDAEQKVTAVLTGYDTEVKTVTLLDPTTGEEQTFSYTGGTKVYSKGKSAILMQQISCGEIVDVVYNTTTRTLSEVKVSKNAWEYRNVNANRMDRTENTISVTGRTYEYDSSVSVFCEDKQQMLMDLNERDEVTIKGVGTKVYSLMITKSHGYVRLGGQDAFIGGTIEVDQDIFLDVQDNMLLTVSEGEHTIVLRNGDLQAIETVTVQKDEEVFLDLSEYEQENIEAGRVRFIVSPADALLYVNGMLRRANTELTLPYGNYNVAVIAQGYEDYTGILRVQKSNQACEKIYIELVPSTGENATTAEPSATDTAGGQKTAAPKSTATTGSAEATATPTTTGTPKEEHTITVKTPEGASVYVDGVCKGVAPVTFAKITGTITITLSKEGYVTRSYSITVPDDGEDVNYSFAALTAK